MLGPVCAVTLVHFRRLGVVGFFFFPANVQAEAGCNSVAECFPLMGEEVLGSISRTERK